jgi:hypothetical protein
MTQAHHCTHFRQYDVLEHVWLMVLARFTGVLCMGSSAYQHAQSVTFPPYSGAYVNMLPINVADLRGTLPDEMQLYAPMVEQCIGHIQRLDAPLSTVYLTVDERPTVVHESQRRPGLHTESPGAALKIGERDQILPTHHSVSWGLGEWAEHLSMAALPPCKFLFGR